MKVTLGSAPVSWGVWFAEDPRQTPWSRFLDEVVAAGYQWIELGPFGYLPTSPDQLEPELDRRGLHVAATFVMFDLEDALEWERRRAEVERACSLLATLGAQWLVLIDDVYTDIFTGEPRLPPDLPDAVWRRLIDTVQRVTEVAELHSQRVAFHPHAQTHVEREHQIERLLAETDSSISLCLDVGHHAYCGGDPIEFIRDHHERIRYLHLKSVDRAVQLNVEEHRIPFAKAVALDVFVEPSDGAVDFQALRDVLDEVGFEGFGIVEQDMYPAPFEKPFSIAKRTRTYLDQIGFG